MRNDPEHLLCLTCSDTRVQGAFLGRSLDCTLELEAAGDWKPDSREALQSALATLLGEDIPSSVRCTIPGRGVLLRDWSLPPAPAGQKEGLIRLQIERSMPVDPDDLIWGSCPVPDPAEPGRVRVLAMRRDRLQPWAELLGCLPAPLHFVPASLALLASGSEGSQGALVVTRDGAEWLSPIEEHGFRLRYLERGEAGIEAFLETVAQELRNASPAGTWLLAGEPEACRVMTGLSTATGVQLSQATTSQDPLVLLALAKSSRLPTLQWKVDARETPPPARNRFKARLKDWPLPWVAGLVAILLALFATRYLAPVLHGGWVQERMEELQSSESDFPAIDRELAFLKHVQSSQPPVLDLLAVVSDAMPRGATADSLTLDRRGNFNLQATLQKQQRATDLRAKLLESGLFSQVVVEEQTPIQNNQKLKVRIQAKFPSGRRIKSPFLEDLDKKAKESKHED